MAKTLLMGAVAYDPKVVTIWDGFRAFFGEHGLAFDYVLYSNYERQVAAHLGGHIHVAWNSPLAWLQAEKAAVARGRRAEAVAMRDTDCDLTSVIVVGMSSNIQSVSDLKGRRVAVGAADSPQATMIPLEHLAASGLVGGKDFEVIHHDRLLGKHGDHIGGERDAARALDEGTVDAACLIDGNHLAFCQDGTFTPGRTRVLTQTAPYDHCNFTVLDDAPTQLIAKFKELLFGMRYDDPKVRNLMDLEGLKAWRVGRTSGYAALASAAERSGTIRAFIDGLDTM